VAKLIKGVVNDPIIVHMTKNGLILVINNLCLWATTWMLKFNPGKCKVLHLGQNNPCHNYNIVDSVGADIPIQSAKEECDIKIPIDNKFKFHSHYLNQEAEANKVLGFIMHSVTSCQPSVIKKLYTALVCPIFSSACWLPACTLNVT